MTGTGGFLIEASLSGRNAIGIDIHSEMVQGANANLLWAHGGNDPEHAAVKHGDATRLPDVLPGEWSGKVAGFVLDPPYGRNSHGSMANDPLLEASLRSARAVAHPEAGFVLILPLHPLAEHTTDGLPLDHPFALLNGEWDVQRLVTSCGWAPQSVHAGTGPPEPQSADPSRTMRSSRLSKTMSIPSGGVGNWERCGQPSSKTARSS